jgi:GNAT superfamily N-acetyltransferase
LNKEVLCATKQVLSRVHPFVRFCAPRDYPFASAILKQHQLVKSLNPQNEDLSLVYAQNGIITGVLIASFRGHVYRLAVDGKFQKQGAGRALLEKAMLILDSEHQAQSLVLNSTKGAIGFNIQKELLDAVSQWIPEDTDVTLLADRFYGTSALVSWCKDHGESKPCFETLNQKGLGSLALT